MKERSGKTSLIFLGKTGLRSNYTTQVCSLVVNADKNHF